MPGIEMDMPNINDDNQTEETVRLYVKGKGHFDYSIYFHRDPRDTFSLKRKSTGLKTERDAKGVLLLYTGGTIGSSFRDNDRGSLHIVNRWPTLRGNIQTLHTTDIGSLAFPVDAVTFEEPLDSADIGPVHWAAMARIVHRYYDDYEGFVILHGTDTLVYTACALSFMFHNLGKPIVVTGSQLSAIDSIRSDAQQNLLTSILIANPTHSGLPVVPEVCVFSRDRLLRGNRAKKIHAQSYAVFDSPNFPPLGQVGSRIEINEKVMTPLSSHSIHSPYLMHVRTSLDTNVVLLDLFPGIQDGDFIERVLNIPGLRGVVLRTYGSGNMPTSKGFLSPIKRATENGIVIMNVTQCTSGMVEMGAYDINAKLLDCGVTSGLDITTEAAFCKLMVLLGDDDMLPSEIRSSVQLALRGEQSHSIYTTTFRSDVVSQITTDNRRWRLLSRDVKFTSSCAFRVLLRFGSAMVTAASTENIRVKVFLNLETNAEADETGRGFVGSFVAVQCQIPQSVIFDITSTAESIRKSRFVSFTMILDGDGTFQWEEVELVQFVRE